MICGKSGKTRRGDCLGCKFSRSLKSWIFQKQNEKVSYLKDETAPLQCWSGRHGNQARKPSGLRSGVVIEGQSPGPERFSIAKGLIPHSIKLSENYIDGRCDCCNFGWFWCWVKFLSSCLGRYGSGGKSCRLAVGGLPVRSRPGRVEVSLSKTPNPQSLLTSWLAPCMAANRRWCVNVCVNGWMRGITCTALWIKALYKCSPFTIHHLFQLAVVRRFWLIVGQDVLLAGFVTV